MKIALVGDYDPAVTAHQAIPRALELAAASLKISVATEWIRSTEVELARLAKFDAIWCVPFSPYENPDGVIAAIRYARENNVPFLGTCAGFQHAVLEYARNCLGIESAESIEDNPETLAPVIAALACKLYEVSDRINVDPASRVGQIYQVDRIEEAYHCGFGVNPEFMDIFATGELKFCGQDDAGEPRILELPGHRFFVGTAFQPERSAFGKIVHPLIAAFLVAAT
jgi:CTP synthase (UTP-ammonia lyase)